MFISESRIKVRFKNNRKFNWLAFNGTSTLIIFSRFPSRFLKKNIFLFSYYIILSWNINLILIRSRSWTCQNIGWRNFEWGRLNRLIIFRFLNASSIGQHSSNRNCPTRTANLCSDVVNLLGALRPSLSDIKWCWNIILTLFSRTFFHISLVPVQQHLRWNCTF